VYEGRDDGFGSAGRDDRRGLCSVEFLRCAYHQEADDETKETHDATEDFYDKDLDEEVWVGCVCECGGGAGDANGVVALCSVQQHYLSPNRKRSQPSKILSACRHR